jgi:hypothetical protein
LSAFEKTLKKVAKSLSRLQMRRDADASRKITASGKQKVAATSQLPRDERETRRDERERHEPRDESN